MGLRNGVVELLHHRLRLFGSHLLERTRDARIHYTTQRADSRDNAQGHRVQDGPAVLGPELRNGRTLLRRSHVGPALGIARMRGIPDYRRVESTVHHLVVEPLVGVNVLRVLAPVAVEVVHSFVGRVYALRVGQKIERVHSLVSERNAGRRRRHLRQGYRPSLPVVPKNLIRDAHLLLRQIGVGLRPRVGLPVRDYLLAD